MSDAPRGRRSGGRAARQAARSEAATETRAFLTRTMAPVEVVSTEGLETIEHNADTILAEVGIDFRDYPSALALLADAGADVDGERVRFPRGMCRQIIQSSAPSTYTQHGRNPDRNVQVGGDATVLV
ncbi:MAG: trimethylamine methyltransferase family protein, partial [Actinomycetota bacterium]|nr:trimethylamine methyltransferase family protein [Actinomycetota bacterium]